MFNWPSAASPSLTARGPSVYRRDALDWSRYSDSVRAVIRRWTTDLERWSRLATSVTPSSPFASRKASRTAVTRRTVAAGMAFPEAEPCSRSSILDIVQQPSWTPRPDGEVPSGLEPADTVTSMQADDATHQAFS